MELGLEELEAAATKDEIAAEQVAAKPATVGAFERKRPGQPFPAHQLRDRIVIPGSVACDCCGGNRRRKLGETVTDSRRDDAIAEEGDRTRSGAGLAEQPGRYREGGRRAVKQIGHGQVARPRTDPKSSATQFCHPLMPGWKSKSW